MLVAHLIVGILLGLTAALLSAWAGMPVRGAVLVYMLTGSLGVVASAMGAMRGDSEE